MPKRKKRSNRKIVTVTELASYFGVHRHTMASQITDYTRKHSLDFYDFFSVLDFMLYRRNIGYHDVDMFYTES